MDISSVISSSAIQPDLLFTSGVRPVFALLGTSATTDSGTLGASTIVDLSELGRLLSASLVFQSGVSESGSQTSFSTVVAATQLFVGAFNSFLQSDGLHNPPDGSLGNLFVQTLDSQTTSSISKSLLASLSEVGINYQAPLNQNDTGQLTIDFQLLQSSFNADPTGTISLLAQASQSVGQLAAKFVSLLAPLSNPADVSASQNLPDATTPTGLSETGITSPSGTETAATTTGTTTGAATAVSTGATTATATGATNAPSTIATAGIENRATTAAATGEVTTGATTTATTNRATIGVTAGTATAASPPTTIGVTSSATTAASINEVTVGTTPTVTTGAAAGVTTAASTIATAGVASQATTVAATDEVISGATASTTNVATAGVTAGTIINATPGVMAGSTIAATTGVTPGTTTAATAGIPTGTTTATPTTSSAIPVIPATNAINPAIVAAIAAYHLDEGIFDNTKAIDARFVSVTSSTIPPVMPVAPTQPAKLDIYT